jgi:hypothetical protein
VATLAVAVILGVEATSAAVAAISNPWPSVVS